MKSISLNWRPLLFLSVLVSCVLSQRYVLSVWNFPIGNVEIHTSSADTINVTAQSTGLLDMFFPFDYEFETVFDPETYLFTSYDKSIRQGSFKQKLHCKWNSEGKQFEYRKYDAVSRYDIHHNIFSLLTRAYTEPSDQLDTKWFYLEHEGRSYRARYLWAGLENVAIGQDSVQCDHYRLDILPTENPFVKILDQTDYFSRNITHQNGVRQLWVDQKNSQEIIRASFTLSGIPILLRKIK